MGEGGLGEGVNGKMFFWKLEGLLNSGRIIKFPSIILPRRKVQGNDGSRQRKRLVSVLSKIVASLEKKKKGPARAQTDVRIRNFRRRIRCPQYYYYILNGSKKYYFNICSSCSFFLVVIDQKLFVLPSIIE